MVFTHSLRGLPTLAASVFSIFLSTPFAQAADVATTCETAKLKAAGKMADCLAKEEAKAILGKSSNPLMCGRLHQSVYESGSGGAAGWWGLSSDGRRRCDWNADG